MMVFALGLAPFAVAVVWAIVLSRLGARRDRRLADAVRAELAATGLSESGDLLGSYTLTGRVQGVDVVLENGGAHLTPGVRGESVPACVVKTPARLEDQIVCRAAEVDAVMGPLPSAPRRRTGSEAFDAVYATFGGEAPWAVPPVLTAMRDLGMLWLRVRDGRSEIAFPPLGTSDLPRAVAVAASVSRISWGEAPLEIPRGAFQPFETPKKTGGGVAIAWGVAFLAGLGPGCGLAYADPLMALDAPYECQQGAQLREVSVNDSDSLECSEGPDHFHLVHYLGCDFFGIGVVALIGMMIVTAARLARR